MILLDGRAVAEKIYTKISAITQGHIQVHKKKPKLAIVLVGNDSASRIYVKAKMKVAQRISFQVELVELSQTITHQELATVMNRLANAEDIDGMILQFPLPKHLMNEKEMFVQLIPASKDVDGFHFNNIGGIFTDLPASIAATPYGIVLLLDHYGIRLKGKYVVVVGRSHIVGKPLALLLSSKNQWGNATVTLCNSHTPQLALHTRQADVVIMCVGSPHFLRGDMVKQGAIVIDVGINRVMDTINPNKYKIVGDVCFEEVAPLCSYITPVPGGVGPMTIAALMQNTLAAYEQKLTLTN